MTELERQKLEASLAALHFIDEPERDSRLLQMIGLPGCIKDCEAAHCGGKTSECPEQRMCDGKCLQRGGCIKDSGQWCAHQDNDCPDKDHCSPKCQARDLPI